jgi:hypothetical protein
MQSGLRSTFGTAIDSRETVPNTVPLFGSRGTVPQSTQPAPAFNSSVARSISEPFEHAQTQIKQMCGVVTPSMVPLFGRAHVLLIILFLMLVLFTILAFVWITPIIDMVARGMIIVMFVIVVVLVAQMVMVPRQGLHRHQELLTVLNKGVDVYKSKVHQTIQTDQSSVSSMDIPQVWNVEDIVYDQSRVTRHFDEHSTLERFFRRACYILGFCLISVIALSMWNAKDFDSASPIVKFVNLAPVVLTFGLIIAFKYRKGQMRNYDNFADNIQTPIKKMTQNVAKYKTLISYLKTRPDLP